MVRIIPTRFLSRSSSSYNPSANNSSSSLSSSYQSTSADPISSSYPTAGKSSRTPPVARAGSRHMRPSASAVSPVRDVGNGLAVQVVIMRARDLAAKDRGGTSDPYLVCTLGDARVVTHTVAKSLNPEWNVIELLPVSSINSLILDVTCWDRDRFGKDYLGEFDLALEEIFRDGNPAQEPRWYPLRSKRPGKRASNVSGEVQLQFTLLDTSNKNASTQEIFDKFNALISSVPVASIESGAEEKTKRASRFRRRRNRTLKPSQEPAAAASLSRTPDDVNDRPAEDDIEEEEEEDEDDDDDDDEEDEYDDDDDDEDDDELPEMEGVEGDASTDRAEKRRRRLRIRGLKRRRRQNPYAFVNGDSDLVGIIFLEVCKITDLPPESNLTRTSFDMDPFVVVSLGKRTYRTRRVRHNLNPVYNEKMIFQVLGHERSYSFSLTVIDHDRYSNNDFIASCHLPIQDLIEKAPVADPETGLYELREPDPAGATSSASTRSRFKRLGLSRTPSTQSITKMIRPGLSKTISGVSTLSQASAPETVGPTSAPSSASVATALTTATAVASAGGVAPTSKSVNALAPPDATGTPAGSGTVTPTTATEYGDAPPAPDGSEESFLDFALPLQLRNVEKWEAKHSPTIYLRAKYMPYAALRQQFWRALLRQYDTDDSGRISRIEMTTMLDTLGSTLRESTIDSFFTRFPHKAADNEDTWELTMDEAVICLEDQLEAKSRPRGVMDKLRAIVPETRNLQMTSSSDSGGTATGASTPSVAVAGSLPRTPGSEMGELMMEKDDPLGDDRVEEHVVEIRECPICHQPRLNKRTDTDIITHIATCASQDWRQVNHVLMSGFVTASQAQRKWYSKVITKISYGGYRLGANSANILVQDRVTGQINEEKMSVYVRLGIRLLYKGLKSRDMEKKRIRRMLKNLTIKQGRKFDDPASRDEIDKFIDFHRLDMSEVLLGVDEFATFNEFFYRALRPGARPCSAPENPRIVVSPADCRSVVFNQLTQATKVWVKGRDFSVRRLLGDAYPEDVSRYEDGGAMGIFRLAPQDYHRFHIPVDGVLGEPRTVEGEYYTVNPMAIRSALDVYSENVRVLVPIDSEQHGRVMVVCVGAMMVGSTVITRKAGEAVRRTDELGYFKFGGSTLLVLFEPGKVRFDDDLVDNSNGALETLIRVGMSIGHSPDEPQWIDDMRKTDREVTEEEKRAAKRRIQGSVVSEDSPSGSGEDERSAIRKLVKAPTVNTLAASAM